MASTIFFSGRVISSPGSYSEVDASGLESVGLGANGIIAVLGTVEGGRPVSSISEIKDILRIKKPGAGKTAFRSGDIREAIPHMFAPAKDADIQAGAQEIVVMKCNPSVQSTAVLVNAQGDALDLTSIDYGAFTSQINAAIATGTNQGKQVTIVFEDITEAVDDLGGDNLFELKYTTSTSGWDTMTAQLLATGVLSCRATRGEAGLDGDVSTLLAQGGVRVVSADAGDVGQKVTVYGLDASGAAVSELLTLNGTNAVDGTQVFGAGNVFGAKVAGTTLGAVTVSDQVIPTTIMTISLGANQSKGIVVGVTMYASTSPVSLVADAASAADVILIGKSSTGATIIHKVLLAGTAKSLGVTAAVTAVFTWNGTATVTSGDTSEVAVGDWIRLDSDDQWFKITALVTNVSVTIANPLGLVIPTGATARSVTKSVADFSEITGMAFGDVAAARTITAAAEAARTDPLVQKTVLKMADFFNARAVTSVGGFVFNLITGTTGYLASDLDVMTSAVNCLDPANPGFTADLATIAAWINQNSILISAAVSSGGSGGAPTNTTNPVFLAGGSEGTAAFTDYQKALNLLKQLRINSVVPLTADPAVAAAIDAHCAYMGGIGRSERDGFVGLMNAALTDVPTKTEAKAQIVDLNSRHMRTWGQAVERFNIAGDRTEFTPPFGAAILAGMQAGSPVGTSLTYKFMNVLSFRQHSTWNPTDDAEEMIQAGLVFAENVDGQGRRVVRNITTHLSSNNLAFTEGSVNEAVNFAVFNFRTNMEISVGKAGFSGTENAAEVEAINTLGLLVDGGGLATWRSLDVELAVEVLEIGVEMAPIIPVNFVKSTIHLVTIAQAAA